MTAVSNLCAEMKEEMYLMMYIENKETTVLHYILFRSETKIRNMGVRSHGEELETHRDVVI